MQFAFAAQCGNVVPIMNATLLSDNIMTGVAAGLLLVNY
jgi:hypothetical protein